MFINYYRNKKKIINDPVYGFINIPSDLIFDLIEHPYFQRLRRIKQLGLSYYVYPGAVHTRFQHVLGAMHLMQSVVKVLKSKNILITPEEEEGVYLAILLHDLGHGPFSHTLEYSFFKNITHEQLSLQFMRELNREFSERLNVGIEIFKNSYPKKFLHQLVSSQLDMDRMDYLKRDSFFTGVSEGVIGTERILKMLNVYNDEIVVEGKGIYSVENFLIARRLMYWQVYLHKTVVITEQMLRLIMQRARELFQRGKHIFAAPQLKYFLKNDINKLEKILEKIDNEIPLKQFALLDDFDIMSAIKVWINSDDKILSDLSYNLINRKLYRIEIFKNKSDLNSNYVKNLKKSITQKLKLTENEIQYYFTSGLIHNKAYTKGKDTKINIMYNNKITDIASASDISNVSVLSKKVEKYFICYIKDI